MDLIHIKSFDKKHIILPKQLIKLKKINYRLKRQIKLLNTPNQSKNSLLEMHRFDFYHLQAFEFITSLNYSAINHPSLIFFVGFVLIFFFFLEMNY